ncbi:MAG: hypothetical protein J0L93_03630 [Deltaproteobacteria bacterium]|nr:hypothetical protein [Deltaproteobacteria bacterium]
MKIAFDFFKKVEKERWSGEVDITSSQGHACLLIKDGQLIWAHRPLDRAIERLEKVEWMHLPPSEVLTSIRSFETLVKEVIAANPDQYARVVKYLKLERLEIFFRIFFWSNVELNPRTFSVEGPDPVEFGFYTPKRFETLINEAQKRLHEWPVIQEKMGSSKRVFVSQVDLPKKDSSHIDVIDQSLMQFDESKARPHHLPFSGEEIDLLRSCDGRNTVEDLIRKFPEGEFLILRRLLELWRKGAIAPKDAEELVAPRQSNAMHFSARHLFGFVWAVALTSAFLTLHFWITPPDMPLKAVPVNVIQAIEIFRELNGHYPLSLLEIQNLRPLSSQETEALVYTLEHPEVYEIKVKPSL